MRSTYTCPTVSRALAVAPAAVLVVAAWGQAAGAAPPEFDPSTLPVVGPFGDVTLNGTPQLTTGSITPFVVADDSGTLNGWNVTMLVPDFRNGSGPDCSSGATATLGASTLAMDAPVVAPADGLTSMNGIAATGYTDFTTARTIVDAATGFGDGRYTISPALLKLVVPASVYAGNYCTQATIAISSGP
ncbi:MAG TPA: hypothetical protein VN636_12220 [Acidimicrobiia bacterium]|nr:hypothetical protein [Acidimicrobiia bacterium]